MMKPNVAPNPAPSTPRAEPLDPLAQQALEILIDALLRQMHAEKEAADGHA